MTEGVAAPSRTWSTRVGDWGFAVDMPAEFGAVRRPWRGAFGAEIAFRFKALATNAPASDVATQFSRLDADGFAFSAATCHGSGDWATRAGTVYLHDAAESPQMRVQMLQEAVFSPCYAKLLLQGGLLLHAATLWLDGRAFVVAGQSTAGKTTLCERFSSNWLSDEHAFLAQDGDAWSVLRHIDFRGNEGDFPWRAPLAGVLWLGPERDVSRVDRLAPAAIVPHVLHQALVAGPVTSTRVLDAVAHLCEHVPVAQLSHCLATPVAQLAAMIAGVADAAK